MKLLSSLSLLVAGLFAIGGCGGGGGSAPIIPPNPFSGTFVGPFTTDHGQSGTATWVIDVAGNVTGTMANDTLGATGTSNGTIDKTGTASISLEYPGQAASIMAGTLSLNLQGHLVGPLVATFQTRTIQTTFDLTPQVPNPGLR